ncbi:tyrosinase family oxidase copper chaperone [Streptomyces sp. NPDC029080]|uniref:tyrosinase family oxidase copper chaperone n=1 Tax=Streptomyces sp. NPDC029080 TaxID=3155017 RepID=UPI00144BA367|nr:tyrosinase [Streptomyces sp. SID2955]
MVVGVGGVAVGAERQGRPEAARPSRRELARGLLVSAAALALTPVIAASRPLPPAGERGDGYFDETYRGRRIQGVLVPAAGRAAGQGEWRITIDGRPLHLMRRADGTWLTMVDHYTSYRTPLEATRAAVDEIGPGRRLRDLAPGRLDDGRSAHPDGQDGQDGHMEMGGRHGVRA